MDFYELLDHVINLLQSRARVSYRALKLQFKLDDEHLEVLKEELIEVYRLAADQDGKMLVWLGEADTSTTHTPSSPIEPQPPEAERRQLTVMFCDLVDSTPLAERLDPEELREVVRAYQQTCAAVIQHYDGHIAQYLGDALLVYFGWPRAHEDDAQRAVQTGLAMLEAMRPLNTRLEQDKDIRLAIRIGIHTGPVVVGEMGGGGRHELLALGETPNVASRIQGHAAPDTVAISDTTYRLIQGYFICQELGTQLLKGVTRPMLVYRVLRESGVRSRLGAALSKEFTPLVGREQEVGLLLERWTQVRDGRGHAVMLSGEAGIGKSRLVHMIKDHVASEPHTLLECQSSPYYQNTALYPVVELFQDMLHWQHDDTPETKVQTLETLLSQYGFALQETMPLLGMLLSLSLPDDRYPSLYLSP